MRLLYSEGETQFRITQTKGQIICVCVFYYSVFGAAFTVGYTLNRRKDNVCIYRWTDSSVCHNQYNNRPFIRFYYILLFSSIPVRKKMIVFCTFLFSFVSIFALLPDFHLSIAQLPIRFSFTSNIFVQHHDFDFDFDRFKYAVR